jgi:hypothetical protein
VRTKNFARLHLIWKCFRMECLMEKFLSHRAAPIPPNCFKSMLELAKGFEPLTL